VTVTGGDATLTDLPTKIGVTGALVVVSQVVDETPPSADDLDVDRSLSRRPLVSLTFKDTRCFSSKRPCSSVRWSKYQKMKNKSMCINQNPNKQMYHTITQQHATKLTLADHQGVSLGERHVLGLHRDQLLGLGGWGKGGELICKN
jgi:hypothetical protein